MNRGALLLVMAVVFGPGGRLAAENKPRYTKPSLGGTVVAVSPDSKTLTLETPPSKKGGEPTRHTVKLTATTQFSYANVPEDGKKPSVGYQAAVWLAEGSTDT